MEHGRYYYFPRAHDDDGTTRPRMGFVPLNIYNAARTGTELERLSSLVLLCNDYGIAVVHNRTGREGALGSVLSAHKNERHEWQVEELWRAVLATQHAERLETFEERQAFAACIMRKASL